MQARSDRGSGRGGGPHAAHAEVVLDGNRHTGERRRWLARRAPPIDLRGSRQRAILVDQIEGVQRLVDGAHPVEARAADLYCRYAPGGLVANGGDAQ